MSKLKYIVISIVLIAFYSCDNLEITSVQKDSFIKLFGYSQVDVGNDLIEINSGYIIAATVMQEGEDQTDIALIKTDKYGNQKEIKIIEGGGNDEAAKLLLTNDGGFIILGTYEDTLNKQDDIYLAKYNSDFTQVWEHFIGKISNDQGVAINDQGVAIAKSGSGFIIVGNTDEKNAVNGNPQGVNDIFLIKTDTEGNTQWTNSFGGSSEDVSNDVISIAAGILILGTTNSFSEQLQGESNIILIQTNSVGNETDKFTYGGSYDDAGTSIIESGDGGYVIAGTINSIGGHSDIYIAKLENDIHDVIDNYSFGLSGTDEVGYGLLKTDIAYVVAGNQVSGSVESAYFLKIDNNLQTPVEEFYGGYDAQVFYSLIQTSDGGFAMVGSSGFEGNDQILLLKVNSDGEL
jgi:hypothetical protein